MTAVIVGCPVSHRQWALDGWFDHVDAAAKVAGVEVGFVFVGDARHDRSFEVIERRAPDAVIGQAVSLRSTDVRDWGRPGRYAEMVVVRNQLLGLVRELDPDVFVSLDSDIMIHPDALGLLVEDLAAGTWDAVGGKCFMTQAGTRFPSWARFGRSGGLERYDSDGCFTVDVIMAIKAMSRTAYRVDYALHPQGEDAGWSVACRRAGLKLGWDGRVASKHVMAPHLLGHRDPRVGF